MEAQNDCTYLKHTVAVREPNEFGRTVIRVDVVQALDINSSVRVERLFMIRYSNAVTVNFNVS